MSAFSSLEQVEKQALQAWFQAAAMLRGDRFRWSRVRHGDAECYLSSTEPSILINRVLGIGSNQPPTVELLRRIRETYLDAGVARFFLHVIADQLGPEHAQILTAAGYKKYRSWMKFERGDGEVRDAGCDLTVRRIGVDRAAEFASIVGDAFDFQNSFQPALAALANAQGWHLYMSFDGDTPAGTGGLFIHDGVGYLDFGSTHPDFRRRGGQTAVLNARVRDALEAGCTSIVTMTGEAVPGDEQHSYRNIERAGFREVYLRENWIPANG